MMGRLRCWLVGHEAYLRQKRGLDGRPVHPHVIVWECARCHAFLGETPLGESVSLRAAVVELLERVRVRIRGSL